MAKQKKKLKIIPLGGLGEIGKNMTAFETENDIVVVDCGIAFPEDDMLGIDAVIPDITYLTKNKDKVRAIVLTHGHEDHIGALPYVLRELNVPVCGTKFTIALVEKKLEEFKMVSKSHLQVVKHGDKLIFGQISVEFIRSTHSIVDSSILAISTPAGIVVHTGDFKIDCSPISGLPIDLGRLAELGEKGVLLLMADSTNIENKGYSMSERSVGQTFDELFLKTSGRIIVATFSSNIHRVQQIIDAAVKFNRKCVVCGRSMVNIVEVATSLGYMQNTEGTLIGIEDIENYKDSELVIITTGSQGEPMSALTRMAVSTHKQIDIKKGDTVIISASPIPGNEKMISKMIDELFRRGANVIYKALAEVHVSGHACEEELKIIHTLIRAKLFMPVHGEYRHLVQHAKLAHSLGMAEENIFILDNGDVLDIEDDKANCEDSVPSGNILVDGLGVGDVGNIVLRDRRHLSEDGLIIIVITLEAKTNKILSGPDVVSRGFVYVRESEEMMNQIRDITKQALLKGEDNKNKSDWSIKKNNIRDAIHDYVYENTKRNPMILPIIMEI